MKPILCVVDLKEPCQKVLEVAASIASKCHSHVIVLFSYRLINLGAEGDISSIKFIMDNEARNKFNELSKYLSQNEITYEFQTEIGFNADRIRSYAKRDSVGMVIIGESQAYDINEGRSFTLWQFITDMKLPFLIVPDEVNVEALQY
jgi:nucleotide-binding universal stress UspA family protein